MIPLDVVPLTGIRTTEGSTSTTIQLNIPSTIPVQVSDASDKLVKSMEDMSIQGEEIRKLQGGKYIPGIEINVLGQLPGRDAEFSKA
jgi:hypothetical protein